MIIVGGIINSALLNDRIKIIPCRVDSYYMIKIDCDGYSKPTTQNT